jgi:hypothetical protein
LYSAGCFPESVDEPQPDDHPGHCPDHPEFAPSFVHVPAPTVPGGNPSVAGAPQPGLVDPEPSLRRFTRVQPVGQAVDNGAVIPATHKPVHQRWFYESKLPQTITEVAVAGQPLVPLALMMGTSPASGSDELVSSGTGASGVGLISSVSGFLIGGAPRAGITEMERGDLPSLRSNDARDGEFTIVVSYPGGEHCTHDHVVFHGMTVDARDAPCRAHCGCPVWSR